MVRTATEWKEISIRINALSSIQEARFVLSQVLRHNPSVGDAKQHSKGEGEAHDVNLVTA